MSVSQYDFSSLGQWPNDCLDQQAFMFRLQNMLNSLRNELVVNQNKVLTLSQTTEPTQAQWEAAWVSQTGLGLPIPSTATLLWYDTLTSQLGGVFGTVTGFATVYRREHLFPRGAALYIDTVHDRNAYTSAKSLYENGADLPAITFTARVPIHIYMEFAVNVGISAGSGEWAIDFLVNGVKIGTQFNAVPPNFGLVGDATASARRVISYTLKDQPADVYVIEPLLGVAGAPGTPPTVAWGSNNNVTSLTVKAFAA